MFKISRIAALLFAFGLMGGCAADTREGRPYDDELKCWKAPQEVEYSGPDACDLAITYARDNADKLWQFSDTCIPDDFTVVNDNELTSTLSAAPLCD